MYINTAYNHHFWMIFNLPSKSFKNNIILWVSLYKFYEEKKWLRKKNTTFVDYAVVWVINVSNKYLFKLSNCLKFTQKLNLIFSHFSHFLPFFQFHLTLITSDVLLEFLLFAFFLKIHFRLNPHHTYLDLFIKKIHN